MFSPLSTSISILIITLVAGVYDDVQSVCDPETETTLMDHIFNPIERRDNYSATSNNMYLVHWPLAGGLLSIWYSKGGGAERAPAYPCPSSMYQM